MFKNFQYILFKRVFFFYYLTAFVLKHILPAPVCLSAITEERYIKSLSDKHYVKFGCDGAANSVSVQGNRIGKHLKLASNGLLYATDFALSTQEGRCTTFI